MSQRSSFTTSYIYCPKCLAAAKRHLLGREKYLCSAEIPGWNDQDPLPVIAGKVGALGPGEEIDDLRSVAARLCFEVCHTLLISLLPEGEPPTVFYVYPGSYEVHGLPAAKCVFKVPGMTTDVTSAPQSPDLPKDRVSPGPAPDRGRAGRCYANGG